MLLLAFASVLVLAVLLSGVAHRTILSTAVLFLVAGILLADATTGVLDLHARSPIVANLAELALFAVLFTDGMKAGWPELRAAWRLPGRALGWGLPLTLLFMALAARFVHGLPWLDALLLGAVLAPTDPVFAAALVGREQVPGRLRHLLNVESGVNDGLALPFVVVLLALAQHGDVHLARLATELAGGILIGVAVPSLVIRLLHSRLFSVSTGYEPLSGVAIGLLVLGLGKATHANLFLAAFAAGVTVATIGPDQRAAFERFGDNVAELLKLAALLVFGALISPHLLSQISWTGWVLALLALVAVRPAALWLSLLRSPLSSRERIAAMWFGPKGFASVVYGLLVLDSGIPRAELLFHIVALTVALSILLHSSTDVLVAHAFNQPPNRTKPSSSRPGSSGV